MMDVHYEIPPRLRLNRQVTSFAATVDDSNFHNTFNHEREGEALDEGGDDGSTPRLGREKMSVDSFDEPLNFSAQAQAQSTPAPSAAERLRAVLSRASSLTPTIRTQNASSDKTPIANVAGLRDSDLESDFETPRPPANGVTAAPYSNHSITSSIMQSSARESLRSIVAHALRSPGSSPERPRRPRRGSMDSSIVEESPVKLSLLKPSERPKRISLSDDERERIKAARSGYADEKSFESFTSSQAVIYDQLRQRLEGPRGDIVKDNRKSLGNSDMTTDMEDTEVEEQLLQEHEDPIKTRTSQGPKTSNASDAQQSMSQFPSQFLGSNLLTESSDMQRVIGEAQTDTTDSEAPQSNRRDEKIPAIGASSDRPKALVRPRAISRNDSVSSISSSGSRSTSGHGMNDSENEDRKRERERGWNHPLGPYMERHRAASPLYPITHNAGIGRMRKVSLGSISGSESDFGRSSPSPTAKRQNLQRHDSEYAGIAPGRFPSSSPNQIRGSDRTRTVSQPTKPSSPDSLAGSAKSDRTQKPFDRSRTISLTAPVSSQSSSSHVHGRLPSKYVRNGSPRVEQSDRPVSPSSSRPSSKATSFPLESPNGHERIHVRKRNWSSPDPNRNAPTSPSLSSERKGTRSIARTATSPTQQRSRVTQATSSSPTSIRRPSIKGRLYHARQVDADEGTKVNERRARNSTVLTALSANTLANVKRGSSSKDKDVRQHILPKADHEALSQYEPEFGRVRPGSPTFAVEMNDTEESEEHDTPRIRQKHIPGPPTPGGSRSNSRAGFSLHSVKGENDRGNGFTHTASIAEKERRQGGAEKYGSKRSAKASIPPEANDLRESDLDSFQEEDIVASSSAPRLPNGSNQPDESDAASADEGLHADVDVLRPGHDLRLNGREGAYGKKSALPVMVSPPLSPPPDPVTSTPQRRGPVNMSKLEFRTPSPPGGMPALPDPPLSEEDVGSGKTPPTPVTPSDKTRNRDAKTPRFPGAWATPFATPAPVGGLRSSTLPRNDQAGKKVVPLQEARGYPASYSRATSTIMKTPAPPGAWFATPGTIAAKRLQQKVRFDENEPSAAHVPVSTGDDGTLSSDFSVGDGSVAMRAAGKIKPASPRTPGRIRIVDAFGNEIRFSKNGDQRRLVQKPEELHADGKLITSDGRKARIRVLDAMGREMNEPQTLSPRPASITDESVKHSKAKEGKSVAYSGDELVGRQLERREALQLLRRTITELKDDFNETHDPASARTTDDIDAQIANLKAQAIRAKEDRERLQQKIRNVNAGNPPSRLSALWTALRGKHVPGLSTPRTRVKLFITLISLQVVMFFAFYWLTSLGARHLYFATYIDPFYPELHMQVINPDYLQLSMATNGYSETHVSTKSSWLGPVLALLHGILGRFSIVKESIWDIWRDAPRSMPWPPT